MANQITFFLETPFGEDVLSVDSFRGSEEISAGFRYTLQVSSHEWELNFEDIIAQPVSMKITQLDGSNTWISGLASHFSQVSSATDLSHYQLIIEPWTWMLTHRSNCRIFQEKSVLEILQEVISDAGFSGKYVDETSGSYNPQEYTVQYRETDFAFISRQMAEFGIYYYFRFDDADHTLVLVDNTQALSFIPGDELPYLLAHRESHTEEGISIFEAKQTLRPTAMSMRDYNFKQPSTNQEVMAQSSADREFYDYPGKYKNKSEGNVLVKQQLEALQYDERTYTGSTNSRRLTAGASFKLVEHIRDDLNKSYLLYKVHKHGEQQTEKTTFNCQFEAIPTEVPFRPLLRPTKTSLPGIQTAVVVGPDGEEIWLDKYGRIKVQFHWDRVGTKTDSSSCWIRVAHSIAGKNWGTVFHPRIGQEVIVQFIEGDVDRPVVTGSLFNQEQMPPYELPGNSTQSTIKTRSTSDGTPDNFNEIRFEDKKGFEHFLLHAEKDMMIEVENDETHTVEANRNSSIIKEDTLDVGGNSTTTITKNRYVTTNENENITIVKDSEIKIGGRAVLNIDKDYQIQVKDKLVIKVGKASITLKKDGTILLDGKNIKIQDKGETNIKASKDIVMKGKNIKQN